MDGLLWATKLNGPPVSDDLDWDAVERWSRADGPIWVHLDRTSARARRYLRDTATLDEHVVDALTEEETRPRCLQVGDGLLIVLRSVCESPRESPEDLIAMRMWVDGDRLISVRQSFVPAAHSLHDKIRNGSGPATTTGAMLYLVDRLTADMAPVLDALDDEVDELDGRFVAGDAAVGAKLLSLRRRLIALHRHLGPQRDALVDLEDAEASWFSDEHRVLLREIVSMAGRHVDDLSAMRERASLVQQAIATQSALQMNRTIYVLSLMAAVFMPLTFVAGLLGMNVAGIPWASRGWAFWAVCGIMAVIAAVQVVAFKRMRMF